MNKLEKIDRDMDKMREKIAEWQEKIKGLDGQRTEQENLAIVSAIRALKMTREELRTFLLAGKLPATMREREAVPAARYQKKKQERITPEPDSGDNDNPNGTTSYFNNTESEDKTNEE